MNFTYKLPILGLIALFALCSCKKEKQEPVFNDQNLAPLSIEFDNIAGGQNLYLNSGTYTNAAGENFSVTLLQYFISNIRMTKADGTVYTVPQYSSTSSSRKVMKTFLKHWSMYPKAIILP